jgi:hypothetical protein
MSDRDLAADCLSSVHSTSSLTAGPIAHFRLSITQANQCFVVLGNLAHIYLPGPRPSQIGLSSIPAPIDPSQHFIITCWQWRKRIKSRSRDRPTRAHHHLPRMRASQPQRSLPSPLASSTASSVILMPPSPNQARWALMGRSSTWRAQRELLQNRRWPGGSKEDTCR